MKNFSGTSVNGDFSSDLDRARLRFGYVDLELVESSVKQLKYAVVLRGFTYLLCLIFSYNLMVDFEFSGSYLLVHSLPLLCIFFCFSLDKRSSSLVYRNLTRLYVQRLVLVCTQEQGVDTASFEKKHGSILGIQRVVESVPELLLRLEYPKANLENKAISLRFIEAFKSGQLKDLYPSEEKIPFVVDGGERPHH